MATFRATNIRASVDMMGRNFNLTMSIPINDATKQGVEDVLKLADADVEIKKHREKRSINANGKMWVLLDKMAEKLNNGTTKEDLYRKYVAEYGVFDFVNVPDKAVDKFIKVWCNNGLGWLAEIMRDSTNGGSKVVVVYYGSSTYDSKQMYRLLSEVIRGASELGVQTMSPDELQRLCNMQGE